MLVNGSCLIDGVDLATLGAFVMRGGDAGLLAFPERKEPVQQSWFERDGVDVDLSEVYFKSRKIVCKLYLKGATGGEFLHNMERLCDLLAAPGLRSLYLREFDKAFALRFTAPSGFKLTGGLVKPGQTSAEVQLDFSDDMPLQLFGDNRTPAGGNPNATYVWMDGTELRDYGIVVRQVYDTTLRPPDLKTGLERTFARRTRTVADTAFRPAVKSRNVTVQCTMLAPDRDAFFRNYDALFHAVSQPGALTLEFADGKALECYYVKMDGLTKNRPFARGVSLSFNLTFATVNKY